MQRSIATKQISHRKFIPYTLNQFVADKCQQYLLEVCIAGKPCKKKTNCPLLDTHCKHLVQYFMNKNTKLNANKNV